ncbi:MAG: hypothetical protein ABSF26_23500, partial [Thermoguttaceae bacterium]
MGSLKPKSATWSTYGTFSSVVTVLLVPCGAWFTSDTLTASVRIVGSVSTPPLAVPPLSCTWKP